MPEGATDFFGSVTPPEFFKYGSYETGLTAFISNIIKFLTIVAGLWALINFVMAGLQYISSQGDPKAVEQAWGKIWMSLIGLIIIATAYGLIALLSYLLFGDVGLILRPRIYGPGT